MKTLISGHLVKDIIDDKEYYGGPAGSIPIYLKESFGYNLLVHSILGTDDFSLKYLKYLKNKDIITSEISLKEGKISSFDINLDIWQDNISEYFPRYEKSISDLENLLLVISNPEVSLDLVNRINPKLVNVYYNPGQYLDYMTVNEINFLNIISKSKYLQLNYKESEKVLRELNMSEIRDLFKISNLQLIAITSSKRNMIYNSNGDNFEQVVNFQKKALDITGGGDRFLATFFFYYEIKKNSIKDSLKFATQEATKIVMKNGVI